MIPDPGVLVERGFWCYKWDSVFAAGSLWGRVAGNRRFLQGADVSPEYRRSSHLFTSESVTMGHPDKVADQISDGILDAVLKEDPKAHVACETLVTTGQVVLAGEVTTNAVVDYAAVARQVIKEIGYDYPETGFAWQSCGVLCAIHRQSPVKGLRKEPSYDTALGPAHRSRRHAALAPRRRHLCTDIQPGSCRIMESPNSPPGSERTGSVRFEDLE